MTAPKFSVVIPTRERAETLRFALRTCLDQTFDDYEIVVSDNFSSPATRAVVDEAGSAKVRYFRTPEPLAMSRNWEFAVERARGRYVTVLGDDDGLFPHALAELDALTARDEPKAVRWEMGFYTWPTIVLEGQGNYLRVPVGSGAAERCGDRVVADVVAFREFYEALPMIYNSVVRRDVLDAIRRRAGGVFPHPIPDVFSGFAVALTAGRFLTSARPMSVRGVSGRSVGTASFFYPGRTEVEREFRALNERAGLHAHPAVPDLPALTSPVADAFLCAKRALCPELPITVDRKALVRGCVTGARVALDEWQPMLSALRASLGDVPDLLAWFDAEIAPTRFVPQPAARVWPDRLGWSEGAMHLNALAFGVTDVCGAVRLATTVLDAFGTEECAAKPPGDALDERGRLMLEFALQLAAGARATEQDRARVEREAAAVAAEHVRCEARIDQLGAQVRELDARLRAERKWSLKAPLRAAKKLFAKLTRRGAGTHSASA